MNKKQKEAKRKNAQAHQKKVRELDVLRKEARVARGTFGRTLPEARHVVYHPPAAPADRFAQIADVFGEFFAEKLEHGSGIPMTPELGSLIQMTNPFPIIGRKCK